MTKVKTVALTKTVKGQFTATTANTWPVSTLGNQPSDEAFKLASQFNKAGTALAIAWAMYARPDGATDHEAAMAATLLTGSKSASHRVKVDQHVKLGNIQRVEVAKRDGKTAYRIALPGKAATKVSKPRKAKAAKAAPTPTATPAETAQPDAS